MSRIRVVPLAAAAVLVPALLGAQSLGGGDPLPPAFSAPTGGEVSDGGSGLSGGSFESTRLEVAPEPASILLTATGAFALFVGYSRRRPRR